MTASELPGFRYVTVVAPTARVDLALAAAVPVADLLPLVLDDLGPEYAAASGAAWTLRRVDGVPLAPISSLASARVPDGAVLVLHPRAEPVELPLVDDVVDVLAGRPDLPSAIGRSLAAVVMVLASGLWVRGVADAPWPAGVRAACLLSPGVVLLGRGALGPGGARVSALFSGIGLTLVVAGVVVGPTPGGTATRVLAAGAASTVVGVLIAQLARAAPVERGGLLATLGAAAGVVGVFTAAAGAVALVWPGVAGAGGAIGAAVITTLLALASVGPLASLSLLAAGVRRPDPADFAEPGADVGVPDGARHASGSESVEKLLARAVVAGALFDGAVVGVTLAAGAAAVVLDLAGQGWPRAVGLAVGVVLGARVRLFRTLVSSTVTALGAVTVLAAAADRLLAHSGAVGLAPALTTIAMVALAAATKVVAARPADLRWAHYADLVELVALAALVPLSLLAVGAFTAVGRFG